MRRFLVGDVSEAELTVVERHLTHCPRCLDTLQAVHVNDALAEALRSQSEEADEEIEGRVEAMVGRLRARSGREGDTPSQATLPSGEREGTESTPAPVCSEFLAELQDYLAPPQGPDELGRLGPYRVLGVLGVGGMGVVFEAEEPELRRRVAVKALLPVLAASPTARQRFRREAQAAAAVEHDHVVHINYVGEDHGIPFVVMPLLRGESLDRRLRREPVLPVAEVLRVGREVAEGLAAAHARGLIHRDIKPANVWLEAETGRVKVLDFGLARPASGGGELTRSGFVVGTPAFMAPEQVEGREVDARADLFSLGCLLYRMCTGRLPFAGATPLQVLRSLATEEPPPPGTFNAAVPPALEALIGRLLAHAPDRRPDSARDVAAELAAIEVGASPGRSAATLPALPARIPTAVRGVWKRLRRRPLLAGLLVLMAACAALPFVPHLFRLIANRGELVVETERDVLILVNRDGNRVRVLHAAGTQSFELPAGDYEVEVVEAPAGTTLERRQVRLSRGRKVFFSVPPPAGAEAPPAPKERSLPLTLRGVGAPAFAVGFSPEGRLLAAAGAWRAKVWDLATGQEAVPLEDASAFFVSLAFRPDGRQLACGGLHSVLRLWDLPSGKLGLQIFLPGEVRSLSYTPDGKRLLSASIDWFAGRPTGRRGKVVAWDLTSGSAEVVFSDEAEWLPVSVACSPDGKQVAASLMRWDPARQSVFGDSQIRVWEAGSGRRLHTLTGPPGEGRVVVYGPDGKHLRCTATDGGVWRWDAETGRPLAPLRALREKYLTAFAFSRDGRRMVTGGGGVPVWLWDLENDRPLFTLAGPGVRAVNYAISPDGRLAASAASDGLVTVWDATRPPADESPKQETNP